MKNWDEHTNQDSMAFGSVGVRGVAGVAGAGYGYKDGFPDYNSPKDEHLLSLIEVHLKMYKEFPKFSPWKWPVWMYRYNKLTDEIQNHKKYYPEYYL